jgi:hypothetical protein
MPEVKEIVNKSTWRKVQIPGERSDEPSMPHLLGLREIVILAMPREAPMHPYQMQRSLRERHKDEILVLKRGCPYHAIKRLLRAHLIAAVSTGRHGPCPERTTYRIRIAGRWGHLCLMDCRKLSAVLWSEFKSTSGE